MTASTRRAALGAILAAPLAGSAVAASPFKVGENPSPTDLARACDWAIAHMDWINHNDEPLEAWPDERTNAEIARFDAVVARVADEPSLDKADLKAKARILFKDWAACMDGHTPATHERALLTFLREVATCI